MDPKASASARFLVSIENKYVEPLPESKPDYDFRTEEEQVDYRVFSDNIKKFSDQILKLKPQIDGYEGKVRVYQVEKESQLVLDYKKSFDELLLLNGLTQEDLNKLASLPPRLGEEGQIVIGWKTGYRASYISIFYNNELIEIKKGLRSFKFKKEVESVRVQEIIHRINKIEDMSYTLSDFIENFVTEDPPEFIPDYDASDANDSAEESMGPAVKTIEEYKKEQNFVQNTERKKETYQKRKKEKNCTQSSIATKNSLPKTKKALEQSKKVFRDALNSISISHLFEDALACLQVPQITNDVEVISEFLKELPKVPTMFVFDDFPTDDIASEFVETLRDTLAFMVKNVITGLLKSAIDSLLSCKDDDVATPNQVDPFELAAAIDKLDDSFNPEEVEAFVDGLATFLSSDELCTLLSGEATEETLQLVQNYIERFFPNLKIQTKSEIENFFITLGESVDFSICFEAMVPQKEFIDPRNLCLEDNELRRRILSEKEGITDSEIEDQILRHNQRRKQLADRIKSALNSPPLSGAFQAPDLFCQRVAGRPISEKNPGVISFSDPTFSEMVDTTVDSMFSSFRDKFNREADDYFSSFFTISTKEFIDPTTQEVTLIPTRELLPSLSKFYSNPTPVIQHEVEALKIPIQENYELLGELQRFIDKREENLQDDRLRKKQIRFIFERLGITIDTPPIAIQGYLRQAVERSNDNITSLRATKLQLIARLNRTRNEAVKIGIQEEIDVIDFSIQNIFQPIAELGDQEFPTANIQSLQQELREIIEREEEVSLVAGQNILPSNSPSRELTLELYKAGNFYDYKISLEQGVFLDVSTGTFPEQSYRNARNLSAAELNFVESTTDVAHRMPLTFFKKLIQKKLSPFSLTPEDLNSIPYPRIYKSLKVKFIEEISKKINSSPYFKEDKGKKAIELIELVKKSSSPECDSHILRLKTLMKEIKDNFSKEFCIDTASLEGKPSKTPFETELMRACIRLTVRHYILEGLLRSIISNSVFATSELEEQAIFDFTFDLMKAEMQKYGTYYDDFLKEVGEWLLDPDLPDQDQPSPNEVMKGLFEAEYYDIKLAFEIAIMKPRQLSETVKEFFINKILLDTEEIMSRQNEHDYRFELGHHSDLVVQRAVRFSFIGGDEVLSRNRVF